LCFIYTASGGVAIAADVDVDDVNDFVNDDDNSN
jgi:hypothetical protein